MVIHFARIILKKSIIGIMIITVTGMIKATVVVMTIVKAKTTLVRFSTSLHGAFQVYVWFRLYF